MELCMLVLNARKQHWNTERAEGLGNPWKYVHIITPGGKRSWNTAFFLECQHRENWVFKSERRKMPPVLQFLVWLMRASLAYIFFSQKHGQIKNVQLTDLLFPEHQVPKTYSLETAIATDSEMHSAQDKKDGNGKWREILRLAESKPISIYIILTTYCANPRHLWRWWCCLVLQRNIQVVLWIHNQTCRGL